MPMQRKLALSTSGQERFVTREGLAELRAAGVSAIEISYHTSVWPRLNLREITALARDAGVGVWSVHLPFQDLDIASPDEAFRRKTLDLHESILREAGACGIRTAVLHPCLEPFPEEERALRMEQSKRSLAELAEFADGQGVVVAVEDLPRGCLGNCSDEILELVGADPRLRVCFDTNHLLREAAADFLAKMRGRIRTVHVSDYDFINERHWLPGEGDVDWPALLAALDATGYEGPLLYEFGLATPATIEREHEMTLDDVARNHRELMSGGPLTTFCRRKENLGMWH